LLISHYFITKYVTKKQRRNYKKLFKHKAGMINCEEETVVMRRKQGCKK